MIIFDNIIYSLQKSGGISVRWKELIQSIQQSNLFNESFFVFYKKSSNNLYYDETLSRIPPNKIIWRVFHLFTEIMNFKSNETKKFIFHSSYYRLCSNKNAFNIITFHDCIQDFFGKGIKNYFVIQMKKRVVKKADHIICNSYTTKKDLLKLYLCDENKVSVIYSGVNPIFKRRNGVIKNNTILFVGNRAPYKKFDFVIDVLNYNKQLKLTLVGGGKLTKKELKLIEPVKDRIEHFLGINEEELNLLYNESICLIHPSLYEGFGVPVIEAMKAYCAVVAYKTPAVNEIGEDGVLYFEKYDVKQVNKLIVNLSQNKEFYSQVTETAFNIAKKFSWEKTGIQTIKLLEQIQTKI